MRQRPAGRRPVTAQRKRAAAERAAEQGYAYRIVDADDLLGPAIPDVG